MALFLLLYLVPSSSALHMRDNDSDQRHTEPYLSLVPCLELNNWRPVTTNLESGLRSLSYDQQGAQI